MVRCSYEWTEISEDSICMNHTCNLTYIHSVHVCKNCKEMTPVTPGDYR